VTKRIQTRQVGDRITAIATTLQRPDGTAVNTTNLTVRFTMVDSEDGSVKVAETDTNVTVNSATAGEVEYAPVAADVDTEGIYYGYFTTEDANGKKDTFPAAKGDLEIDIQAKQ
jgi:hypothetical protein